MVDQREYLASARTATTDGEESDYAAVYKRNKKNRDDLLRDMALLTEAARDPYEAALARMIERLAIKVLL